MNSSPDVATDGLPGGIRGDQREIDKGKMTLAVLLAPGAVFAQDTADPADGAAEPPAIAPTSFTAEEIRKFAKAAMEINKILEDAMLRRQPEQAREELGKWLPRCRRFVEHRT
jgi:hypothetical protein